MESPHGVLARHRPFITTRDADGAVDVVTVGCLGLRLCWEGSQAVYRCPVPRQALRLAQQTVWFARHLAGHVRLIRQGHYWEVVVPPATSAAGKAAALEALRAWPRRVPRRRLPALQSVLWRSGLPVAWIGETGRRLGTIAERALHCRWA
jgi:hypothetical protein